MKKFSIVLLVIPLILTGCGQAKQLVKDLPSGSYTRSTTTTPVVPFNDGGPPEWIKVTSPKPAQIVKSGQQLKVSGKLTNTALFNTTMEVGLFYRNTISHGFITTQKFQVSKDGAFAGEFGVPKSLAINGTEYFLIFQKTGFYIPLKVK